jgi:hypothetical protein
VGPTAPPPFLMFLFSAFLAQLAVSQITLEGIRMVSRHAQGDARHIDGQDLSLNHYDLQDLHINSLQF